MARNSPPAHIVMLVENNPYPQDGRVRREAVALVRAGFAVSVVAPRSSGQTSRERIHGVDVIRYRQPFSGDSAAGYIAEYGTAMAKSLFHCIRLFVRKRFRAIHAHNPPDTFVFIAGLFKPLGVKFVFDHHDLSPELYDARFPDGGSQLLHRVLRFLERTTFALADLVISTNESYAEVAMTRGRVPGERVVIVRNGPDPERVRLVHPDADMQAKATYLIGYVGEMAPHDGVNNLIEALSVLAKNRETIDFHAVLIGGGSELPRLNAMAERLEISDHITFTGPINDADTLMAYLSATVVCVTPDGYNPYTDKSTTVKTAEYMALGKPVVAFDLTENRKTAGASALYADPDDVADLASKIDQLLNDAELRAELGRTGAQRVADELSWPHQSVALVEAYGVLLGRNEQP